MRTHIQSQLEFPPVLPTRTVNTSSGLYLFGLIPVAYNEVSHDMGEYIMVVAFYPSKERILGFKSIYDSIQDRYKDRLIPAFYCVENGSGSSWFSIYLRK